jgi:hypothetical protein
LRQVYNIIRCESNKYNMRSPIKNQIADLNALAFKLRTDVDKVMLAAVDKKHMITMEQMATLSGIEADMIKLLKDVGEEA